MPSTRSILFRFISWQLSRMMASRSTIQEWRAMAGTGVRHPWLPRGVRLESAPLGNMPAEWLIPEEIEPGCVILHFHGGGWILGWDNSHRFMMGLLAKIARARVLAIDYRLAPEHPFPAALEDCLEAYHFLLAAGYKPESIFLVGDSAGGNLALTTLLALKVRGEPLPAAVVCMSPVTDLFSRGETYQTNAKRDAILPDKFTAACGPAYVGAGDRANPLISPIRGDLAGLPPLLIQAGGDEKLLSDATRFAEKARDAKVDVTLEIYPGMWHVWQIYAPYLPEAMQALNSTGRFIRQHRQKTPDPAV